jgi:hypothetical protein
MQLNELLEQHSIEEISSKTKIDKKSLENLFALKFFNIRKARAVGFVSILEREYKVDISKLKSDVEAYYSEYQAKESVVVGIPREMPKRKNPKILLMGVATFVVFFSIFLFTQIDNKTFNNIKLLVDTQSIHEYLFDDNKTEPLKPTPVVIELGVDYDKFVEIVPIDKLWMGIIEVGSLKRDYFVIDKSYGLDISTKTWLVATSALNFSIKNSKGSKTFNDEEEHYFKKYKNDVKLQTQKAYFAQGGWDEW